MDNEFADDRFYGIHAHESAGEDLYQIAGRILSDLKADAAARRLPKSAVWVVAVQGDTITVQGHLQNPDEYAVWAREGIRARATVIADRYNWRGVHNRADVRFRFGCTVRVVKGRLDASQLGSIIG